MTNDVQQQILAVLKQQIEKEDTIVRLARKQFREEALEELREWMAIEAKHRDSSNHLLAQITTGIDMFVGPVALEDWQETGLWVDYGDTVPVLAFEHWENERCQLCRKWYRLTGLRVLVIIGTDYVGAGYQVKTAMICMAEPDPDGQGVAVSSRSFELE